MNHAEYGRAKGTARRDKRPAGPGAAESNLTVAADGQVYLSWLERAQDSSVALRFARYDGTAWTAARTIRSGRDFFVNWADFPSLAVHPGEILGLYGLVGAGRSELLRSVVGLHRVTAGEIRVNGTPVTIRSVRAALRDHRIGYVTENRKEEGLFLDFAVRRNVAASTPGESG